MSTDLQQEIKNALILLGADDSLISAIYDGSATDSERAEKIKEWRRDKVTEIKTQAAELIDRVKKQPTITVRVIKTDSDDEDKNKLN